MCHAIYVELSRLCVRALASVCVCVCARACVYTHMCICMRTCFFAADMTPTMALALSGLSDRSRNDVLRSIFILFAISRALYQRSSCHKSHHANKCMSHRQYDQSTAFTYPMPDILLWEMSRWVMASLKIINSAMACAPSLLMLLCASRRV
jgi:hypothetical protein